MSYKKFEGACPECGTKVYLDNPLDTGYCSKQCETNFKWRKSSFKATQNKNSWTTEKTKKM